MLKIVNLKDNNQYIEEVARLEHDEWAINAQDDRKNRINNKIMRIKNNFDNKDFCKLILLDNDILVGFISIFPNDSDECALSPWYATMYVKEHFRHKGYSKLLNNAILKEAKKRGYKEIYLKTELNNYYEKFGAKYLKKLNSTEKLYKFDL